MLDIKYIVAHPDEVKNVCRCASRNWPRKLTAY